MNGYPQINRDNNFDVVRLFAALQVCCGHTFAHFNVPLNGNILNYFPGVIIFFALSGFLITSSWVRSKSVKNYARNRLLRIFPALFVCFIVLQLAMALTGHITMKSFADPQMWVYWIGQLSLGQFFTPDSLRGFGVGAPNGSLWTIPVEIEFYIILPILFILLPRINVKWKMVSLATFSIIFNVVLAAMSSNTTMTNANQLINEAASGTSFTLLSKLAGVTVLPYLYCFLIGSIIYLYWDKIKVIFVNRVLYWLALYFLLIYLLKAGPTYVTCDYRGLIINLILACTSISAAFSLGNTYKLLCGVDISYGIYIIHMVVVNVFIELGYGHSRLEGFLAILITIILAVLSFILIERPALKLKKRRPSA